MSTDAKLLVVAIVGALVMLAGSILALVLMFKAADRGDTAETVAWGVLVLGFWLSPTSRSGRDR